MKSIQTDASCFRTALTIPTLRQATLQFNGLPDEGGVAVAMNYSQPRYRSATPPGGAIYPFCSMRPLRWLPAAELLRFVKRNKP